jgi:crotonobetainyl-CoA:carnitine CoA-transferase CaiB-like acyl-CoA transferase
MRLKLADEINAILQPIIASQTTEHWLQTFNEVGVPVSAIQNLAQVAAEAQFEHRLAFTEINRPGGEDKVRVVSASHMANPAPPIVQSPPPTLGAHNGDILAELGYSPKDIDQMREEYLI